MAEPSYGGKPSRNFGTFATRVAQSTGKPITFFSSVLAILAWAVTGPIFHYSDSWQLVVNTGTTIVTFLMVFLIQNTQNRDGAAIQAKLDELIRASAAQNRFIGIEALSEEDLAELRHHAAALQHADRLRSAKDAADQAERGASQRADEAAERATGLD